eukprot:6735552-Lingulodinium_polyedra.AAC.1
MGKRTCIRPPPSFTPSIMTGAEGQNKARALWALDVEEPRQLIGVGHPRLLRLAKIHVVDTLRG